MEVPNHPQKPFWGKRQVPFSRELWIEKDDFQENPEKGLLPPFPGQRSAAALRLCREVHRHEETASVRAPITRFKSGTPGSDKYKVQGQHPLGQREARLASPVHLYDRLFKDGEPARQRGSQPESKKTVACAARAFAEGREARRELPVRAPRLFHP
jgi:glutaminyl-tRNA synthetase